MVRLTMTPAIVEALDKVSMPTCTAEAGESDFATPSDAEPSLESPAVGKPITHTQIIALSHILKSTKQSVQLSQLLRGSRVYTAPPVAAKPKTPEYLALMARLRAEQEACDYDRMTATTSMTGSSLFAHNPFADTTLLASNVYVKPEDLGDDDNTFADVNRQLTLVINVVVSIVCCAAALWLVARWWSTSARLALSFGGSVLVAVAEVGIYWAYIKRVEGAKEKERKITEVKEVIRTWVVGGEEKTEGLDTETKIGTVMSSSADTVAPGVRKRRK